jgi:hypothetical protein
MAGYEFNGTIDEVMIFNRSLTTQEVKALYNASAYQYYRNFTNLFNGTYDFQGFAVDAVGNKNQTELRTVTIDTSVSTTLPPSIEFVQPTPNDGELTDNSNLTIAVNVTTYNSTTLSILRYRLYNSSIILINETYTTELNLTFAGLTPDTYFYNVWVNDSAGNNDTTSDRSIIILPSCFNLSTQCIEDDVCNIEENCYLHSEICTDNDCNFTIMITNATIYTLYDDNGNGRDLKLTLTSNTQRSPLTFLSGAKIFFSGRNGSDIGSGSSGGSGGILNITVPDLLNLTNAEFIGRGGYNSLAISGVSGDGGHVILNFHGLIQNYSNDPAPAPAPDLTKGDSIPGGAYGSDGTLTYNKDLETCPRDADVDNDGEVYLFDYIKAKNKYNNITGESGYDRNYDTKCDNKINVIDLTKIGFEYGTRNIEE